MRFAGFDRINPEHAQTHSFKARQKYNVLDDIDQAFVQRKFGEHCGDLMRRFFPEASARHGIVSA